MRLLASLFTFILLGASAASAQGFDGASLCRFDFQACVPFSDDSVRANGLDAGEKAMVEKLRQLTVAPSKAVLDDIAASFGPLRRPGPPDLWFPDARDTAAKCFDCGLHLIVLDGRLVQINWGLSGRFRLIFIAGPPIKWFEPL